MSIGWNGDLRTASLYFRDVPAGLQDACTKAADEIARLQEAKRAALKVADERSKENVKLRATLAKVRARADQAPSVEAEEALNEIGHIADEALAHEQRAAEKP